MKLWLDQNLSRRLVPFLQEIFPGNTQVALLRMDRTSDAQIWEGDPIDLEYPSLSRQPSLIPFA